MKTNSPIGIFDSGLGGLTVLRALKKALPNESFIYFGDTAHLPYGNKSEEAVIEYSKQIVQFLVTQKVKLIIVACNTASSLALRALEQNFSTPIIDVISPINNYLLKFKKQKKFGIIGTYNTIHSLAYNKAIKEINKNAKIYTKICPLFVPIIEEGLQNHKIAHIISKQYFDQFIKKEIDILILGCTHYPLMLNTIKQTFTYDLKIINSADTTAQYVKTFLTANSLLNISTVNSVKIYVSDYSDNFEVFASKALNKKIKTITTISI